MLHQPCSHTRPIKCDCDWLDVNMDAASGENGHPSNDTAFWSLDEDEDLIQLEIEYADVNSYFASSSSSQPRSPRRLDYSGRNRLRGRLGIYPRSGESSSNIDIPDWRSPASMRSKRKASSPTEQTGKVASPKNANQHDAGGPTIATKDIFPDSRISSPGQSDSEETSRVRRLIDVSDDEIELSDSYAAGSWSVRSISSDPARPVTVTTRTMGSSSYGLSSNSHKSSAVLITREPSVSIDNEDNYPSHGASRIQYLPLCSRYPTGKTSDPTRLTIMPSHRAKIDQSRALRTATEYTWPLDSLPVELFDLITGYLSRDDIKSMRLVNTEFERKTSRSLFYTSVVPFNTELYDMIDDDKKPATRLSAPAPNGKGKEKAIASPQNISLSQMDSRSLQWQNAKDDKEGKVYKGHGLRVFRGFGPHIKRFGMSFEVSEEQLSQPLSKKDLNHVVSYHGSYDWPSQYYTRFAKLAGLENTADETSRLKAAFSNLEIVRDLALSVDSGLGWLTGPDKSLRSRIFKRPSPVFGSVHQVPDRAQQDATEFWAALKHSHRTFGASDNLREVDFEAALIPTPLNEIAGLRDTAYADTSYWSSISESKLTSAGHLRNLPVPGVIFTTSRSRDATEYEVARPPLVPNNLSKTQKEWLLETQWAQQAFMESYMLAVIDNPTNFTKVATLNIAKVSSRFLSLLSRTYFWDALPSLSDVTLLVSADWRSVDKDDSGLVDVRSEFPSKSGRMLHKDILRERISPRRSIKRLTVGWVGGGEHAEGMFARNNNVLPAPVTQIEHCTANSSVIGLVFPHVEHLTLTNCWLSPPILEGLVKVHATQALKKLTLDSVSLTTHPKFPPNAHPPQVPGVPQAHHGQAIAQGQAFALGGNPQPLQMPPPPNLTGLNQQQIHAAQNQWVAQVQQMQQMLHAQQNAANGMVANQALNLANFPPLPPMPATHQTTANNPPPAAPPHWTEQHREGSWPEILDIISPGPTFSDYRPEPAPWEPQLDARTSTNLKSIELKSCGYVKLPRHSSFDQTALDNLATNADLTVEQWPSSTPWFSKRHQSLRGMMMETRDRYLGNIVPAMPHRELDALRFAWGLRQGWLDEEAAEEALFDGCPSGGTGRISGVIEQGMELIGSR